jgi:hypothetical protein
MRQFFKTLIRSISNPSRHLTGFLAAAIAAVSILASSTPPVKAEVFDQFQVKAVFLYNLVNFVTWPPEKNSDSNQPFVIGVLGRDTLVSLLEQIVASETTGGRGIHVRRLASLEALRARSCDLLFINSDQMHLWPKIRKMVRSRGVLTVSDVADFGRRGGMINLLTAGRKIRIEINVEAARRNGFKISAKLLRLAQIVSDGKDD